MSQPKTLFNVATQKANLRTEIRTLRRQMCPHHRVAQAQLISDNIADFFDAVPHDKIALYMAVGYEVNLSALLARWQLQGCEIYLPRLDGLENNLEESFRQFTLLENLEEGALGLRQPSLNAPAIDIADLDIIIIPGIAFDRQGNRLGQGGGWYDRRLALVINNEKRPVLAGVCYDEQMVDAVPRGIFDVKMDFVFTANSIWQDGKNVNAP